MQRYFNYKNFNMGIELDIAGTFIYDGINSLKSMENFEIECDVFSFLYHIAVGIERIQKIVVVLSEDINNIEEFEQSLITHSHMDLHDRIRRKRGIRFNSRENEFLNLIANFYKSGRYNNYLINSDINRDINILNNFLGKYVEEVQDGSYSVENLNRCKEILGRVIGSIVKIYYKTIEEICSEKNIYTYETRYDSKARKIFLPNYRNNSLNAMNINEVIAMKELLIYLANSEEENGFMNFLRTIEPLDIDAALIQHYLSIIINGRMAQEIIDEIEYLYGEEESIKERLELLSLIGNRFVPFDE